MTGDPAPNKVTESMPQACCPAATVASTQLLASNSKAGRPRSGALATFGSRKGLFGNQRSNSDLDPRYRHGRRRPAPHDFVEPSTESRGCFPRMTKKIVSPPPADSVFPRQVLKK